MNPTATPAAAQAARLVEMADGLALCFAGLPADYRDALIAARLAAIADAAVAAGVPRTVAADLSALVGTAARARLAALDVAGGAVLGTA